MSDPNISSGNNHHSVDPEGGLRIAGGITFGSVLLLSTLVEGLTSIPTVGTMSRYIVGSSILLITEGFSRSRS